MALGTLNGPTFFEFFSFLSISAASTIFLVDGPPDPIIIPVSTFETRSSDKFACLIASSIAI